MPPGVRDPFATPARGVFHDDETVPEAWSGARGDAARGDATNGGPSPRGAGRFLAAAQRPSWPHPPGGAPADPPDPAPTRPPARRPGGGARRVAPSAPRVAPEEIWGPTTLTLGPHTAAGVSYLFWWISGLVIYFNERRNRFVRFHAVQSILLTGALTVFGVLAYVLANVLSDVAINTHQPIFLHLGQGIALLTFLAIAFAWLGTMIAAWSGNELVLPLVGAYAERFAEIPPDESDAAADAAADVSDE